VVPFGLALAETSKLHLEKYDTRKQMSSVSEEEERKSVIGMALQVLTHIKSKFSPYVYNACTPPIVFLGSTL